MRDICSGPEDQNSRKSDNEYLLSAIILKNDTPNRKVYRVAAARASGIFLFLSFDYSQIGIRLASNRYSVRKFFRRTFRSALFPVYNGKFYSIFNFPVGIKCILFSLIIRDIFIPIEATSSVNGISLQEIFRGLRKGKVSFFGIALAKKLNYD